MNKNTNSRTVNRCKQWGSKRVTPSDPVQPPASNPGSLQLPGFSFSFFPTPAAPCVQQGKTISFSHPSNFSITQESSRCFFETILRNKTNTKILSSLVYFAKQSLLDSCVIELTEKEVLAQMFTPRQEISKIVPLFYHPAFESTLYPEDDILKLDASNRHEVYAQRIIALWESLGLRRPQQKRRTTAYQDATGELVAVMKGQHPRLPSKKLPMEQIVKSVNHWALATLDHNYLPVDKKSYRALDIPSFIYSRFLDHSYLIEYLEPPRTPQKEINPALTKTLMSYFSNAKWGETKNNVDLCNHIHFIKASNRLMVYLDEHRNDFQPLMKLNPKNPNAAARGLIACAQKSGNWNNYNPEWLYNNISFGKLDVWLRNNGYFKTTYKTVG